MVKLLNALNTYGVLADDNNLDFIVDVLRALKYVPTPQDAPCSDGCGDPKSCVTFYPWHGGFEFSPGLINGVDTPPDGYAQHPWFTGDRYTVPGFTLRDTDVLADFVSTRPDGSIAGLLEQITVSGLPRFRFTFEALTAGTAYIHLLDVPLGGYALVRLDEIDDIDLLITDGLSIDDLLEAVGLIGQLVDDLIDLDPAELIPEHIHELSFGPGTHTIDVLLLPRVELPNLTAIGWGGGIRKIVICGEETVCPDPEDDMPRTELRSIPDPENVGCKILQWKYETEGDTLWRNLATVCDGEQGPQGPPGDCGCPDPYEDPDGTADPDGPPGDDKRCEVAARVVNSVIDRRYAPFLTDAAVAFQTEGLTAAQLGDELENWTLAGASGAFFIDGLGGTLPWNSWTGVVASLFSIGIGSGGITARVIALWEAQQALDVLAIRNEVQSAEAREALICALYNNLNEDGSIDAATYSLWKSSVSSLTDGISTTARDDFVRFLDQLVPLSIVRLSARDTNAPTDFDCALCEVEADWTATMDFRIQDWGFVAQEGPRWGEHVTGIGWVGQDVTGAFRSVSLDITKTLPDILEPAGTQVTALTILWKYNDGRGSGANRLQSWGGTWTLPKDTHGFRTDTLTIPTATAVFNAFRFIIVGAEISASGDLEPGEGEIVIQQMRIYGTGTRPPGVAGIPD